MKYAEQVKVLPILAAQDIAATATATSYFDVSKALGPIEIAFNFGVVTSTDSTGEAIVTIEASTAGSSNATEVAIPFKYRLSAAVNTDNMGAITDATSNGVGFTQGDDNKILLAYVDPAALAALGADYNWLRGVISPTTEVSATLVQVTARFRPRYAGNAIASDT